MPGRRPGQGGPIGHRGLLGLNNSSQHTSKECSMATTDGVRTPQHGSQQSQGDGVAVADPSKASGASQVGAPSAGGAGAVGAGAGSGGASQTATANTDKW